MIVAAIICLVAALAIPAYKQAIRSAKRSQLAREMRTSAEGFEIYAADHTGSMPDTAAYGAFPAGMESYLPKNTTWSGVAPGGGSWAWLWFNGSTILGSRGFVAVLGTELTSEDLLQMDETLDDGNLSKGGFIRSGRWLLYGVD